MEAVLLRLRALGYETPDPDGVAQAVELAREELLTRSNLDELPDGMQGILTEHSARKYLLLRGVREVKLGDMRVSLTDESPDVSRFRKVVW